MSHAAVLQAYRDRAVETIDMSRLQGLLLKGALLHVGTMLHPINVMEC